VDIRRWQWEAFIQRIGDTGAPTEFGIVVDRLGEFLLPPTDAARTESAFRFRWQNEEWALVG
jgi:hypothetical protein